MGIASALVRTWLRRNVAASVLLVVLVAVATAVIGASLSGARRADSALDRFVAHNRPSDVTVFVDEPGTIDVDAVEHLPQVLGASRGAYGLMTVAGPGGGPFPPGVINPFITARVVGERTFRPYVVEGREPTTTADDEVAIDEDAAVRLGAGVGDTLTLRLYRPDQIEDLYGSDEHFPDPRGREVVVVVTGIVRHPFDLNPVSPDGIEAASLASADIHLREGFWRAHADEMAYFGGTEKGTELVLANGAADVPALEKAVRALPGGIRAAVEARNDSLDAVRDARQTVRFEAVALVIFAVLMAVVFLVVVGQSLSRQVRSELAQRDVLAGIGLTRRDLASVTAMRMAPIAVVGSALGVVAAWLASSLTPIGFGRKAEVQPGRWFDAPVLLGVAGLIVIAMVVWAAHNGWRRPDRASTNGSGARLASQAARLGAPVPVVTGLGHLTSVGHRGAPVPLRSSLGAVLVAVAGVVAVTVYAASMDRFVGSPADQGWTWDVIVGDADDEALGTEGADRLGANDDVVGYASVWTGTQDDVGVAGVEDRTGIAAVETLAGDTSVRIIDGVPARGPDEVVLGSTTMRDAGVGLGDQITLTGIEAEATFRVVGEAVLHELVSRTFELGEGAVLMPAGLQRIGLGTLDDDAEEGEAGMRVARFLVDLRPGVTAEEATPALKRDFGPTVIPYLPPLDVASLEGTRSLPAAFAVLVTALGIGSILHLLLVTVRRRRGDFAVLAALGARRRQLRATVASLATAVALIATGAAVPLGVIVGRLLWRSIGDGMGAPTGPVTPALALALGALAVVVVANLAAAVPGRIATQIRPAVALRRE